MPFGKGKKPDRLSALYEELDKLVQEQLDHRQKFRKIFEQDQVTESLIGTKQEQIKKLLQERFRGKTGTQKVYSCPRFYIEVQPKHERIIDKEKLLKEKHDQLVELGAIVKVPPKKAYEDVDIGVIDRAMYNESIPKDFLDPYKTAGEAKTPSVSFKQPQPAKDKDKK